MTTKKTEGFIGEATAEGDAPLDLALADRLRQALIGRNRTQISAAAGKSDKTLTKILGGHRARTGTLASIADALGVRSEWLIDGDGDMRPEHAISNQTDKLASLTKETGALEFLTDLSFAQQEAVRTSIILAFNALGAAKRPILPLSIANMALDYVKIMAGVQGGHNERLYALDRAVGSDIKRLQQPGSES